MPCAVRAAALAWQQQRRPAVVVEVLRHQGSVPRESGTRMLVADDDVLGTIGGGHLEWKAIADAREVLHSGHAATQRIALGPSLGQCCGGVVELAFTPLARYDMSNWPALAPLFTLQLYGAGHVGRAIVRLLMDIDCQVQWIDEREAEFPAWELPPHITRLCVEPVHAEVKSAPAGAAYLVLTHSHDLDLAITQAILARGDFGYVGLIGSRTKRARFESRLQARGLAPAAIARMVCPIGVPGVVGKEPQVIAVAVVAQLLQHAAAPPVQRFLGAALGAGSAAGSEAASGGVGVPAGTLPTPDSAR